MAKKKDDKPKRSKPITTKAVQSTEGLPPPTPPKDLPPVTIAPEPDEDPWGDDGLTHKQRLFCIAYVGTAAGNATKAAKLAGYRDDNYESLRQQGHENLTKPNCQRAIARLVAQKLGSAEWVRAGITEIANANIATCLDDQGRVDLVKALHSGAMGAIKEIKQEGFTTGEGLEISKVTLKMYDRLRALELNAKLNGQLVEKHHVTGTVHNVSPVMGGVLADPAAFAAAKQLRDRAKVVGHVNGGNGEADKN
jgi:hypothetical protein